MTLRSKIMTIVGTVTLLGIVFLVAVVGSILAGHHRSLEEQVLRRNLSRAERVVEERLASLQLLAEEWASWERSLAYLEGRDGAFPEDNLDAAALAELGIATAVYLDRAGRPVAVQDADGRGGEVARSAAAVLAGAGSGRRGLAWLMEVGGRPMLLAVAPVAPPVPGAQPAGYFAVARPLEGSDLSRLAGFTDATVTLVSGVPTRRGAGATIQFSGSRAVGRAAIPAPGGAAGMSIMIERSRDPLVDRYSLNLLLATLLVAIVCAVIPFIFVDRMVFARVRDLAASAAKEGARAAGDELDVLAARLSGVLDELRLSTEGLRESEARWRLMVESAPMAIGVSVGGKVAFLNPAGLKILGMTSQEEVVGRSFLDLVHPDFRTTASERVSVVEQHKLTAPATEYPLLLPDGRQITIGITSAPITYGGSPAMLTFFRDISARKRADVELGRYRQGLERLVQERTVSLTAANERLLREGKERERVEAALRESEELYRTLVAASPLAVAMTDLTGQTVYASSKALTLLGYHDASEVVGHQSLETIFPEDRELAAALRQRLLTEGIVREEIRMLRSDGSPVPVEVNMGLARDSEGSPFAVVGTFMDITERLEAERRLRESEELYRTLVDAAPMAVVVIGLEGRTTFVSPRALALFGIPEGEDAVGKSIMDYIVPEERARVAERLRDAATGPYYSSWEYHFVRTDGTVFPAETNVGVLVDAEGTPVSLVAVFTDSTERHETQRRLRESEELYRTLVETAPVAVINISPEGSINFASRRALELFAIPPGEEIVGRSALDFVDSEDRQRAATRLALTARERRVSEGEYRLVRADGTRFFASAAVGAVTDAEGKPVSVVMTFSDVTMRIEAERRIRESEELYRSLVHTAPIGVIMSDNGGAITYFSERGRQILGIPDGTQVIGRSIFSMLASEDEERARSRFWRAFDGLAETGHRYTYEGPDGRRVDVLATAGTVLDDERRPKGLVIAFIDVTEMVMVTQALEDSDELNRVIVENAPVGIIIHRRGNLLYHNELSETMFGYGGDSGVHGLAVMEHIHPDDREMVEQRRRMHRASGATFSDSYTVRMICRDGTVKHTRIGVGPIWYQGEMALMVSTIDVTDRVRTEEGLQEALDRLEQQNVELTRLDRLKDGLIRDVTHELKTPVAKLRMQLELLEEELVRGNHPDAGGPMLLVMRESLLRQESVIRNILNLARLESGGRRYERTVTRIDTLLTEVVDDYRFALEAHGMMVEKDLRPVVTTTDKEMLSHVLSNLLGNAIKYRSHDRKPAVSLAVREADRSVIVTVMDNGIGMTEDEIALAFERFWQASAAAEGAGVGLSIAKRVVEDLGGTIELSSPGRDQGSIVTVTLPLEGGGTTEEEGA
jgi:PAS domain S-box-containing protein